MNLLAALRSALRALAANKLRSVLTMLGIIIGVGAVITMIAVGRGATDRVQAFAQAIEPLDFSRPEMQIASDLHAAFDGRPLARVRAADIRARMASVPGLQDLGPQLQPAVAVVEQGSDMAFAQL
mgnify:CR=1 FL=1